MASQSSFGSIAARNVIAGTHVSGGTLNVTFNEQLGSHAPRPPPTCRAIHFPRNDDFVQRSAISKEIERLLPPKAEYQSAALWGLGGSGKTQIALEYAYSRCSDPLCSVFWVHADTETSFAQDYKWIARKVGLRDTLDGEDLLEAVRCHVESLPQWVFILDNADDLTLFGVGRASNTATAITPNLFVYVPRGPLGTVLWTSRDQHIVGSLVRPRWGINVVRMTDIEAETLLKTMAVLESENSESEGISQLLAELDWLPLAISQAAAYIRRKKLPISEYLKKIQERKKRWKELKRNEHDPHRRPQASNSVLETWNISIELIQQENKLAYDILTILAYLDSQNISFDMIVEIAQTKDTRDSDNDSSQESSGDNALAGSIERSTNDSGGDSDSDSGDEDGIDGVLDAVARLEEFSFLTLRAPEEGNQIPSKRAYDMHKLVQAAISYKFHIRKGNRSEEAHLARTAFQVINKLFPGEWRREIWDKCDSYIGHAQRAGEWAQTHGGEEAVAGLLLRVSNYLFNRSRWREKESVDSNIFDLHSRVLGDEHPVTIASMVRLATTYYEQGKYKEAEEIDMRVLNLQRDMLGHKHPNTVFSMESLAKTYFKQGRYSKAEEMHLDVLKLRREVLGDEHPDTIDSMASLATTYHKQGRYSKAVQSRLEVLQLRQKLQGEKHPDAIDSMERLGEMYFKQARYREAEGTYVQVLKLRREVLGDEHPDTIDSMSNVATTYHQQGRYKEAEEIDVEVLKLRREVLGDEHPDTIDSMANIATTHHKQGRYKEAEEIEIEVLKLRRNLFGYGHSDTIDTMEKLASTYLKQGRYNEAEEIGVNVLELQRSVLGYKHPDTISSMARLARMYYHEKRYEKVEKIEMEVLKLRQDVLGEKHPNTIDGMASLGTTYYKQRKYEEAEKLEVEVLNLRREVLGDVHRDTIDGMSNLAMTYSKQGKYKEAEEIQVEVLKLRREVLGDEHPDTIDGMSRLAMTYYNQRRYKEAEDIQVEVSKLQRDVLGDDSPDTIRSIAKLDGSQRAQYAIPDPSRDTTESPLE